jgi:hypothetical protein
MITNGLLLSQAKQLIAAKVGWGNSADWTNQDFIALSKRIQQETGAAISHVTLKRLWGKVEYDGLPQIYTLNTIVQFIGYEDWRDFKVKNTPAATIQDVSAEVVSTSGKKAPLLKRIAIAAIFICLAIGVILFIPAAKKKINPEDYAFASRKTIQAGLPNSVVFDYDATRSPSDSVIIQQSWDARLRTKVSKHQRQQTLIYYFPGFFTPKLLVEDQVVKEHDILIPSDGWLTAFIVSPVPVYFHKEDVIANGKMSLSIDKIKAYNIRLTPDPPLLSYWNVQDFGEIYSNDFVFETSVRNDYREGAAVCQLTNIYLLCEGKAINIPLCAKGCESAINFLFTDYRISGKQRDLSSFGVDFSNFVKVRIESANGKAQILLDDQPVFQVEHDISKSKIIGINFVFQGTGAVDYVRLSNRQVSFEDEF